jgi:hypothetical protein
MDEEDLAELNDSRTLVDTTEEMDFPGPTQGNGNQASEQEYKGHHLDPYCLAEILPTVL